jgi:RNA polymerase sigma-19 factor, ECF subfamily
MGVYGILFRSDPTIKTDCSIILTTKPPYDEKTLLSRIAQGDEIAFTVLFYTYHNKLGTYILRLTDSFPLAEEIVQDVFLKIWQNRSSLTNVHHFEAYLFVIARNKAFNCLKQIARERSRKLEWEKNILVKEEPAPGEEQESSHGYDLLIDKAVDKLPPQQKKVYILHNHEGMEHAEIAIQLGLSPETVKKHMSLALRSIREFVHTHIDPVNIIILLCLFFL